MPDFSEGTFSSDLELSAPRANSKTPRTIIVHAKGQKVAYFGNAVTFVARDPATGRWQYQAETIVHDDATMIAELGDEALAAVSSLWSSRVGFGRGFRGGQNYFETETTRLRTNSSGRSEEDARSKSDDDGVQNRE